MFPAPVHSPGGDAVRGWRRADGAAAGALLAAGGDENRWGRFGEAGCRSLAMPLGTAPTLRAPDTQPRLTGDGLLTSRPAAPAEQAVVTLVAHGRTNAQIAAELYIASARSGHTWTGSGTRPATATAPT